MRKANTDILPSEILWRKNKIGFEAPSKSWLSDSESLLKVIRKSKIINMYCNSNQISLPDMNLLWRLYNIARWEEIYNVEAD